MANDLWNGSGNWTGNPTDWSTGAVPGASGTAEIQTGTDTLSSATTVASVQIDAAVASAATLYVGQNGALTVTNSLLNHGTFDVASNGGDGFGNVTIGGTLTNTGTANIGNGTLFSPITVSAAALTNTGTINLAGNGAVGSANRATLDIAGAAPSLLAGSLNLSGNALLSFGSGGIQTIANGVQLSLDGAAAQIDIGDATGNSALSNLQTNAGTFDLEGDWTNGPGGASVTTSLGLANIGTLRVDANNGAGDSSLNIGGVLYNLGSTVIGNSQLGVPSTVSATRLVDNGSLTVQGNQADFTSNQAQLSISGAAPTNLSGNISLEGDALLAVVSGSLVTVGTGAELLLEGAQAQFGNYNTALNALAVNEGTFDAEGNLNAGPGGVSMATGNGFTNLGTFRVDAQNGAGDSSLDFGGAFDNYGSTTIGNSSLSVSSNVDASGYANNGTLTIVGSDYYQTINQATLDIQTSAAPATLTGSVSLYGDALLEFHRVEAGPIADVTSGNGITTIGYGASLLLAGAQARIALDGGTANDALDTLSLNNGTFSMEGNSNGGPGGVVVGTSGGLNNVGYFNVDSQSGNGDSDISIGGALTNAGIYDGGPAALNIGNSGLSAPTLVTATALTSSGTISLYGNAASHSANQAALEISGAAPGAVRGSWTVAGDALMQFGSGSVATIDDGSSLTLDGAEAQISKSGGAANSALKLSNDYGTLSLQGNTGSGAGGVTLATPGALFAYILDVDNDGSSGGSSLTVAGTLTNADALNIGNGSLSADTTVTVKALTNDGSIELNGNDNANGDEAILNVGSAAGTGVSRTLTGFVQLNGYSLLEFASGSIATIAAGATLNIETGQSPDGGFVADKGALGSNSALTQLSNNAGTLGLAWGAVITTNSGVGFTNTGTVNIDNIDASDGGSALNVGAGLVNRGTMNVGGGSTKASTVTATSLSNLGTMSLAGNSTAAADVTIGGGVTNDGTLSIGNDAELNAGAHNFVEQAGTATIAGTLAAAAIYAEGGVVDFTTAPTSTGTLNIYGGGTLEFGAAESQAVNFKAATGVLELGLPAQFTGTIAGFAGEDIIDLLNATVTGVSYASGTKVLTVSDGGTTVGKLKFTGSYTNSSFVVVSDGHGGTDIILTAVAQWNGSTANWSTAADWTTTPTTSTNAVIAAAGGYTVTVSSAISVGAITITDPNASLVMDAPSDTIAVTNNVFDSSSLVVDGAGGGTTVTIGGALDVTNAFTIGDTNGSLSAASNVTAAALFDSGSTGINLWGNNSLTPTFQATLTIGTSLGTLAGGLYLHGDSLLDFSTGNGITTIAKSGFLQLDGVNSRISLGAGTTNSGLDDLATVAGTFDMEGNWNTGPGGSTVATSVGLNNSGTVELDVYGGDGASTLSIGGTLNNSGALTIGSSNGSLSANTTVTAKALTNTGTINLWGNEALTPTALATLDVTGAAPGQLTGGWYIHGDALVEFKSGGITSIAADAELQLDGVNARISIGAGTTNSGLDNLATNAGTFDMEGNWSTGPGGSSVSTNTGFTNIGTLQLDTYGGDGASSLSIGGTLNNSGTVTIGNSGLSANTTVTAKALVNDGTINLWGSEAATNPTARATLDITGAAPGTLVGNLYVHGDSWVEFASGSITAIAAGIELQLDGKYADITSDGAADNSALSKLSSIAGTFDMEGDWSTGPGGAAVTTTKVGLAVTGTLSVDGSYGNDGGSSLTIGGELTNRGIVDIGNSSLGTGSGSSSTDGATVMATALTNEGTIDLQGNTASATVHQAVLDITGAASGALNGTIYVRGDADLEFKSGSFTTIAANALLEIDGSAASVSDAGGTVNSALRNLSNVTGRLLLRGNSSFGAGGVTLSTAKMTVTGDVDVDEYSGDGGSNLSIVQTLVNDGTFIVGNTDLSAATLVSAASLTNRGSLSLVGGSSHSAELSLTGTVSNYGTVSIGADSVLNDSGHSYIQYAGTTTVAGTLKGAVADEGGLVDFTSALSSGDGTGALDIYAGGTLEFGAGVDSSHKVTFEATSGDLELGAPSSFAGKISGFGANDVIDLLNTAATGFSYNSTSGVMTVTGAGNTTLAKLDFLGDYSPNSFTLVGDGHGGTDIVDPPTASSASTTVAKLVQSMASFGAATGSGGVTPVNSNVTDPTQMLAAIHV